MREIEIKLPFADANEARRRLGLAGAVAKFPRGFEDNRVYDNAERSFSRDWRLLRLRSTRGRHILTYKHPPERSEEGTRYKVRMEHETEIANLEGIQEILRAIGYEEIWRYQKQRQRYELDGVILELDEMPFGVYLELEGAPADIDRVAAALSFSRDDYIQATYRELYCAKTGSDDPGDLLFEGQEG